MQGNFMESRKLTSTESQQITFLALNPSSHKPAWEKLENQEGGRPVFTCDDVGKKGIGDGDGDGDAAGEGESTGIGGEDSRCLFFEPEASNWCLDELAEAEDLVDLREAIAEREEKEN